MTRQIATKSISSIAAFSKCGKYRYKLQRKFMFGNAGMILFVMLNPSTADEHFNDPTVAKCERIALQLGYNELAIANLFAFRATDPLVMQQAARKGVNVVGELNNQAIIDLAKKAAIVVCAWGNDGSLNDRSQHVVALLKKHKAKLHYLELNKSGEPKHPLYVAAKHLPKVWSVA